MNATRHDLPSDAGLAEHELPAPIHSRLAPAIGGRRHAARIAVVALGAYIGITAVTWSMASWRPATLPQALWGVITRLGMSSARSG